MGGLRTELGQLNILSRHFFGRMFRNETVDFEDQMKERLIVALTLQIGRASCRERVLPGV